MQTPLSTDRADKFRFAVGEILNTIDLSFPHQIIFKNSGKLCIFFLWKFTGLWCRIYMESQGQVNLLTSTAKIMGKSAFSAPQSEISGAALAVKMHQKINLELHNESSL